MLRHLVAQPIPGTSEYLDVRRIESDFFLQFPIHRLLGRLAAVDAAVRTRPRVPLDPVAPSDTSIATPVFLRVGLILAQIAMLAKVRTSGHPHGARNAPSRASNRPNSRVLL